MWISSQQYGRPNGAYAYITYMCYGAEMDTDKGMQMVPVWTFQ